MPDQPPLIRQWLMLKMLGSHRNGVTLDEMATEARVNKKTIRRDLQAFQQAGFRIDEQTGPHGRKTYRITLNNNALDLTFSFDEALSLYMARSFLEPLAGTMLWESSRSAFQKIRASLGRNALKYVEQMSSHIHANTLGKNNYADKSEMIDTLLQAIEERKWAFVEYQSLKSTEPVTYELAPYGIVFNKGSLYLIAHSRDYDEVRNFKIDRMTAVDKSKFPFTLPTNFKISDHLADSFGVFQGTENVTVKVRFSPTVARYVQESKWHASQKLSKQKDGGVIASFQLSSLEEIKRWLLTFGRHAIVQEPPELREALLQEAREIARAYGEGDQQSSSAAGDGPPSRPTSRRKSVTRK